MLINSSQNRENKNNKTLKPSKYILYNIQMFFKLVSLQKKQYNSNCNN